MKKAFTLIELIFVIVIIGVLATFAVPKFSGLTDNAKISAELATASAVQGAIDSVHSQWITNRCEFMWGANNDQNSTITLNDDGFPKTLDSKLQNILKNVKDWELVPGTTNRFKGPASSAIKGVSASNCKENKPCSTKYWEYNATNGTFSLVG